jgi:hypothetical protein
VFQVYSGDFMMEQKFVTPLKVGLFAVTIAYFLFTFHAMFTLSWIGEWEALPESMAFAIFVTDIAAAFFLVFRLIASVIAVSAMILYFSKKGLPQSTTSIMIRLVIVFEGLYWLGLLASGIWGVLPSGGSFKLSFLLSTGIPCLVSSIGIPISLFKLASKIKPNKPQKEGIKWAMIAGILYIVVFWLNNTGMWIVTLTDKGIGFLTASPESLLSFASTVIGLLALAIFMTYFAKKSIGTTEVQELKLRTIGAIVLSLGLYFLWNYLTWIYFGGWNAWYAWFLGHNLDLWMLSLPLLGLPLLFYKAPKQTTDTTNKEA